MKKQKNAQNQKIKKQEKVKKQNQKSEKSDKTEKPQKCLKCQINGTFRHLVFSEPSGGGIFVKPHGPPSFAFSA